MPDYQEMYQRMVQETEKAIRILISVQQECEELYLRAGESSVTPFPAVSPAEPPASR